MGRSRAPWSPLGDLQLLAAAGYAGAIMFFMISAGLGKAIAVTSLVSPALGARDFQPVTAPATKPLTMYF